MQNGKKQEAKGPTKDEFVAIMAIIMARVRDLVAQHPNIFGSRGEQMRVSFDNEAIQNAADLTVVGITKEMRLPLAPYGCDIHKVIEHAHAIIKQQFMTEVADVPHKYTPEQYWDLLTKVYNNCIKARAVRKDVMSLPATYQAIIAEKGGWPNKAFR